MKPTITTNIRSQLAELAARAEQRDLAARAQDSQFREPKSPPPAPVVYYTLPSIWASYIINRDRSSLTDDEKQQADQCLQKISTNEMERSGSTLYPVDVSDESWFAEDNDWDGIGGMVSSYVFHYGPLG